MKVHKSEHRGSSHAEKLSEERRVGGPPSFVASAGFGATLAELIIGVAGGWGGRHGEVGWPQSSPGPQHSGSQMGEGCPALSGSLMLRA